MHPDCPTVYMYCSSAAPTGGEVPGRRVSGVRCTETLQTNFRGFQNTVIACLSSTEIVCPGAAEGWCRGGDGALAQLVSPAGFGPLEGGRDVRPSVLWSRCCGGGGLEPVRRTG